MFTWFLLSRGHTQQEHETSHGSMTQTRWAIDGADETSLELGGRRFSSNDDGGPMMCNLVCSSIGRHVHIDYCRTEETTPCEGTEIQHLNTRMTPNPDKSKDAVTHDLYWCRMGTLDIHFSCSVLPKLKLSAGFKGHSDSCIIPKSILKLPPRSIYSRRAGQFYEMVCFTS